MISAKQQVLIHTPNFSNSIKMIIGPLTERARVLRTHLTKHYEIYNLTRGELPKRCSRNPQ